MSSRSSKAFVERKGWRKKDNVVLFVGIVPISQEAMRATMDPFDILVQQEEREEREGLQEHVVFDRCIVPISSDAIEATMNPEEILINREFCLSAS